MLATSVLIGINSAAGSIGHREAFETVREVDSRLEARPGESRDVAFLSEALHGYAWCVSRGYRKTARLNGYQGGAAVLAECFGAHERAAAVYSELVAAGHPPDRRVFKSMLSIADRIGCGTSGRELWADMARWGVEPDHGMYLSMINALGHAGELVEMRALLDEMAKVWCWLQLP